MRRLPILAAIAALSVSTSAHAEQWWFVGMSKRFGNAVELDSAATSSNGNRRVWNAGIFATPQTLGGANDIRVVQTLFEVDCKEGRIRDIQSSFLTKDLESRQSFNETLSAWSYPAPGSNAKLVFDAACGQTAKGDMAGPLPNLTDTVDLYFRWLATKSAER